MQKIFHTKYPDSVSLFILQCIGGERTHILSIIRQCMHHQVFMSLQVRFSNFYECFIDASFNRKFQATLTKMKIRLLPLALLRLTKPIITLSVGFSALTAYILHEGSMSRGWFLLYLGVLLTAAGSSAINQIQEAKQDKMMARTQNRPIPSGQITSLQASVWAFLLVSTGALILWRYSNPMASGLSLTTVLWYNGVYTPLKKITPWAILPGAVVGAIPPAIGWVAAGGALLHPHIVFLCFFFFIGQIPHFWLILLRHSHDYEKGGFPSISTTFTSLQIRRLTFSWTLSTAMAAVCLTLFGIISSTFLAIATVILSIALVISFGRLLQNHSFVNKTFIIMNLYFMLMMIIIILDAVN